jgi:hypothetical protein
VVLIVEYNAVDPTLLALSLDKTMMLKENDEENEISKAPSSPTKPQPPASSSSPPVPLQSSQLLSPLTNPSEDR